MKTNLKNFPKLYVGDHVIEWKENFEAELREMLQREDVLAGINSDLIIKEILGE